MPKRKDQGFLRDLSPETQAKRARLSGSPWRRTAGCISERARASAIAYRKRGKVDK